MRLAVIVTFRSGQQQPLRAQDGIVTMSDSRFNRGNAGMIKAYAAQGSGEALQPFEYAPGPLGDDEVEIQTEYCGICHSDLSMLDNDWGMTDYPFVPGHEIIGTVVAAGGNVSQSVVGQRVGVGWNAHSCMTCEWCVGGDHNLCASAQGVIVGRHGGFADRVRADAAWIFQSPDG